MISRWKMIKLSSLMLFTLANFSSAVEIWSEDFQSYALGTGIKGSGLVNSGDYPSGVTKWSLDMADASLTDATDYFMTQSGVLEGQDVDGTCVWTSVSIDISAYSDIGFSLDLAENGDHEDTDFINVEYRLNGGSWTLIADWNGEGSATETWITGESGSGDSGASSQTVTQSGLSGSTLKLRVAMRDLNTGTEQGMLDNIIVTGSPTTIPDAPTGITTSLIKANEFTVMWNAVSTSTNYTIDVSTSSSFGSYEGSFHDYLTGTDESVTITGLAPETPYWFRLRSMNSASNSSYSATNSETTTAAVALLSAGDLYFTGYNAATNEDLAFALFEDVAAGTTLHFSDEEWNGLALGSGGAFSTGGEAFSWYSGASLINAGAVVVFSDLGGPSRSASVGSLVGENTSLNVTGDAIFCFYGSDSNTPTSFIAAIGNGTVSSTFTNLNGTGLIENDTTLALSSGTAIGAYTNARSGYTKEQFKVMLVDEDNWIRQTDGNVNGHDSAEPDAPFDSTPFSFASPSSLNAGDIAFVGFDISVDEFAFVALTNIAQATAIVFTDDDWSTNTSSFAGGEGSGTWTASSAVSAGSVITITLGGSASSGTWSQSGSFGLAADGDPLFAYQGAAASPTFLAGIRAGSWSSIALPSTLTPGLTSVNFGNNTDSGYYYNIKTTGTIESLKTAINNGAGWTNADSQVTFPTWSFNIQSSTPTLVAGDIAFIAYDLESDRFAFVAMTNIAENTEVAFTDIGWDKTDLVPDVDINVLEEHTAVWTAPAGGLSYGNVIRIQGTTVTGGGTISGSLDKLAATGDQLLAFRGTVTAPTFIAALGMYPWRTDVQVVAEAKDSHLPSALTEGQTAVMPTDTSVNKHGRYYGERFAPRATLLPAINTAANWQLSATQQTWLTPWRFAEIPPLTLFKFQ